MNNEEFIREVTSEVKQTVSMSELDKNLKSINANNVEMARAEIFKATKNCLDGKLTGYSFVEIKNLADYLFNFKRTNYLNIMKSTFYDDGLVYTYSTIELAICDYIINYSNKKQEEKPAVNSVEQEKIEKEKLDRCNQNQENPKKKNKFKGFLNKIFKNDREMGE